LEVSLLPEDVHMEDMNIADIDDMEEFEDYVYIYYLDPINLIN
jgi:hypothetical protein